MKIPIIAGVLVGVLAIMAYTNDADAAFDAFLKIDSIPGEATSDGHKDWINLLSVSTGVERNIAGGASGSTRQRASATLGDIVAVKEVDKSSPLLFLAVANGQNFPQANIDLTRSAGMDGKSMPYLQWELKKVIVTSYSISGSASGDSVPTEQISLNYEEVKYSYTKFDEKGKSGGKVEVTWKVEEGAQ